MFKENSRIEHNWVIEDSGVNFIALKKCSICGLYYSHYFGKDAYFSYFNGDHGFYWYSTQIDFMPCKDYLLHQILI
jgi:hypothetical protein